MYNYFHLVLFIPVRIDDKQIIFVCLHCAFEPFKRVGVNACIYIADERS